MAANTATSLTEIDFDGIKNNLKLFLQNNNTIRDYDFAGSNINTLLDILSYNTYLNNFYLNMIANEMFLDTATTRDAIVSHIKELNYVPRSFHSAKAVIDIQVFPEGSPSQIVLPKFSEFTTTVAGSSLVFSTQDSLTIKPSQNSSGNTVYVANNVDIFEGKKVEEFFTVSSNNFVAEIANEGVDTRHLEVNIKESQASSVNANWTKAETLFGLSSSSNSYFLEPTQGNKFRVTFGDGTFGKKPVQGNILKLTYRNSSGNTGNNAKIFNSGTIDGHSNVVVSTVTNSLGGLEIESIEDIKFNAPKSFQVQERAVTSNDYKILAQKEFPQIKNVLAFGGEQMTPPQYGKVILAVDLADADGVPESLKKSVADFFKKRSPVSIDTEVIIPEFLHLDIKGTTVYNITDTAQAPSAIASKASAALLSFAESNINGFDVTYRNSKALSAIDASDNSIVSTELVVRLFKKITPSSTLSSSYAIDFNNELEPDDILNTSTTLKRLYLPAIESSLFTFGGSSSAFFIDDGAGGLKVVKADSNDKIVELLANAGTVDYTTGKVNINSILITAFTGTNVDIFARTKKRDITTSKGSILQLNSEDISITANAERL